MDKWQYFVLLLYFILQKILENLSSLVIKIPKLIFEKNIY